jgi:hypothetical protein
MYAKIFAQIFDSSIAADWQTRHVFEDLLKLSDRFGIVDITPRSIAGRTGVPLEIVQRALEVLAQPDPDSRTPDEDGRRITLLDPARNWGWRIVNYEKYRAIRDEDGRREYQARWIREKRTATEKMSTHFIDTMSTDCQHAVNKSRQSTMSTHTEADADTDKKHRARGAGKFVLPSWIDAEAWAGYEEMRAAARKKPTDRARSLIVGKLEAMRNEGHDPSDALRRSTMNNWVDVYPPTNPQRPAPPSPPTIKYADLEALNAR